MIFLEMVLAMQNFMVQEVCRGLEPALNEKAWEEWLGFRAQQIVNSRYPLKDVSGLEFNVIEDALRNILLVEQ